MLRQIIRAVIYMVGDICTNLKYYILRSSSRFMCEITATANQDGPKTTYTLTMDHQGLYNLMVTLRSAVENLKLYLEEPRLPTIERITRDMIADYEKMLVPIEAQLNRD